jgi:hypothetical protein
MWAVRINAADHTPAVKIVVQKLAGANARAIARMSRILPASY